MTYKLPSSKLLERYNRPVPRYTSYPTAPHFGAGVDDAIVRGWLAQLPSRPVSLYLHLPYCQSLCFYCGCNMKVTRSSSVIETYLRALKKEIREVAGIIGRRVQVSTLHMGGGTPTYIPAQGMKALMETVRRYFDVLPDAEISAEGDPRHLSDEMVAALAALGFNRVSLGVQDTDLQVQRAINRVQPPELNRSAVERLRVAGIGAINVDLVYGLPLQSLETAARTIADVLELNPDRLALFGYAHVPWMKKHQKVLEKYNLPGAVERLRIFNGMANDLLDAGYEAIGFDHFARPGDALAVAARQGRLHRNFMGYTPDDAPVLLGLGASAVSQLPQGFAQNTTPVADYLSFIEAGKLPVARGLATSERDAMMRDIIENLTCQFRCDLEAAASRHGFDTGLLAPFYGGLHPMLEDGLAELEGHMLSITERGKPFARVVAACFDEYLAPVAATPRHSSAV